MKKTILLSLFAVIALLSFTADKEKPVEIPASPQRSGDPQAGYEYLTTGDFLKSGVPYSFFIAKSGKSKTNYLNREGKNALVSHEYNVITNNGVDMVIPTCMQCHAQVVDDKLIIGLGNTFMDFSNTSEYNGAKTGIKVMEKIAPKQYEAAKSFFTSFVTVRPEMVTSVRGVNAADRLAMILVAHRDPVTLEWSDKPNLTLPEEVVPTDVPAWWLMKKKNAMFYTGFGRGDFTRFLMLSNLLTVKDTTEAREVSSHFGDVLAYIRSLEPPAYPHAINEQLAAKGRVLFENKCSQCHGTYGAAETYPNLLVPISIIKTDSMLFKSNQQYAEFLDWFGKSWFAQGDNPARLVPYRGYIAPPLDGIWITAPYLHNGSVPTLKAVLSSKARPKYWSRDFDNPVYDYEAVGWKYQKEDKPIAHKVYNTTLPGYGNQGHNFGDSFSDAERDAVIEYLKTL